MKLTRRSLLQGAMAGVALPWWLGGDRRRSAEAQDLINYAISDLNPGSVLDAHTHVVGIGTGGSGCWVNPHMLEPIKHPVNYGRFMVYRQAAGIEDIDHADQEFVAVLADRVAAMPMPGTTHTWLQSRRFTPTGPTRSRLCTLLWRPARSPSSGCRTLNEWTPHLRCAMPSTRPWST
jgi:hypothetical protein